MSYRPPKFFGLWLICGGGREDPLKLEIHYSDNGFLSFSGFPVFGWNLKKIATMELFLRATFAYSSHLHYYNKTPNAWSSIFNRWCIMLNHISRSCDSLHFCSYLGGRWRFCQQIGRDIPKQNFWVAYRLYTRIIINIRFY